MNENQNLTSPTTEEYRRRIAELESTRNGLVIAVSILGAAFVSLLITVISIGMLLFSFGVITAYEEIPTYIGYDECKIIDDCNDDEGTTHRHCVPDIEFPNDGNEIELPDDGANLPRDMDELSDWLEEKLEQLPEKSYNVPRSNEGVFTSALGAIML